MKVREAMHKGVHCVEPGTPIRDVARQMRDNDVGAIPVRSNGQIVGMVTDRDITCRAVADGSDISRLTAADIMSRHVVCCSPDDAIDSALHAMEQKKVRRLPVTDSHGLVGMLSLGDISHKAANDLSGEVLRAVSGHHRS